MGKVFLQAPAQRFARTCAGVGTAIRPIRKMIRRRKLLDAKRAADSPASGARFVGRHIVQDSPTINPIAVFKERTSPNDTSAKMLLQFLLPKSSQNILLFLQSFQLIYHL